MIEINIMIVINIMIEIGITIEILVQLLLLPMITMEMIMKTMIKRKDIKLNFIVELFYKIKNYKY